MKMLRTPLYLLTLALFAGCAAPRSVIVSQSVGPVRSHPRGRKGEGELVVYSALEVDTADSAHPTHSSYTVYQDNGLELRHVDNRAGSFYQDPVRLSLPVGTYKVKARATNTGSVMVSVVIEEGEKTVLDLNGDVLPQDVKVASGDWVHLPNGQVIGAATK